MNRITHMLNILARSASEGRRVGTSDLPPRRDGLVRSNAIRVFDNHIALAALNFATSLAPPPKYCSPEPSGALRFTPFRLSAPQKLFQKFSASPALD